MISTFTPYSPALPLDDATLYPFDEITQRVSWLIGNHPERRVWEALYEKGPLNEKALTGMHDLGWKVVPFSGLSATCNEMSDLENGIDDLTLQIPTHYQNYQRDKALFHVLMPAHYGVWVSAAESHDDGTPNLFSQDNRTIVEWLARQARANPKLLNLAINLFELQPQVYDGASYLAHCENGGNQSALSFMGGATYTETFMDSPNVQLPTYTPKVDTRLPTL
jgi:hypothetical protein